MKIAIVKLSALGDIVHAMIVLQFIKKYNQEIEVDWVVEENYKELLEYHPDINKVHVINIKKAKNKKSLFLFLTELRRVRLFGPYDFVIDMQGLIKSALIARIIPSKLTVGFDKKSLRESLAAIFYNKKFAVSYSENIIKRNFSLVIFALGLPYKNDEIFEKNPFLYSSNKYDLKPLSNKKKKILLIIGASFQSKCYPTEKLIEFINRLDANYFVVWGNKNERSIANNMQTMSKNLNVLKGLSLDELISVVIQMDLVIGPDTGPTHIAWALNIPSITLFGPTPGYRNSLTTKINKVIESDSIVNPYKINKNDFSIKNINVANIVKIAKLLLKVSL
jgi:heptosyltransferase I